MSDREEFEEWEGELPTVGVECEIQYLGKYNNNWMPFRVTAVTNDFVIGYIKNDRESAVNHKDSYVKFRPLKSQQERQHLRDDLMSDLSAGINRVSRRSLDGTVVMSSEEWNGIVELVEKLLTAAPTAPAVHGEPVAYISHTSEGDILGWERQFDAPSHTPLYAAPQPLPCQECGGDGAGGEHEEDCAMVQPAEQKPAPDVTALVEAMEHAIDRLEEAGLYYSATTVRCRKALDAYRKGGEV